MQSIVLKHGLQEMSSRATTPSAPRRRGEGSRAGCVTLSRPGVCCLGDAHPRERLAARGIGMLARSPGGVASMPECHEAKRCGSCALYRLDLAFHQRFRFDEQRVVVVVEAE